MVRIWISCLVVSCLFFWSDSECRQRDVKLVWSLDHHDGQIAIHSNQFKWSSYPRSFPATVMKLDNEKRFIFAMSKDGMPATPLMAWPRLLYSLQRNAILVPKDTLAVIPEEMRWLTRTVSIPVGCDQVISWTESVDGERLLIRAPRSTYLIRVRDDTVIFKSGYRTHPTYFNRSGDLIGLEKHPDWPLKYRIVVVSPSGEYRHVGDWGMNFLPSSLIETPSGAFLATSEIDDHWWIVCEHYDGSAEEQILNMKHGASLVGRGERLVTNDSRTVTFYEILPSCRLREISKRSFPAYVVRYLTLSENGSLLAVTLTPRRPGKGVHRVLVLDNNMEEVARIRIDQSYPVRFMGDFLFVGYDPDYNTKDSKIRVYDCDYRGFGR